MGLLLYMHSRRVAPVQFTASPKRVKDKTSIINFDDSENVENFSFPLHSLVFQTLLQRKTTLKVAKNYIESGDPDRCALFLSEQNDEHLVSGFILSYIEEIQKSKKIQKISEYQDSYLLPFVSILKEYL